MKKFLKAVGVLILAAAVASAGYIAGRKDQLSSITSAIPRETIEESQMPQEEKSDGAEPAAKAPEAVQTEKNIIEKTAETSIQPHWSEVENVSVSQADGSKADVKLYTSAEYNDGEFVWDDRNQWVLEVAMDGGYYTLINKYVQLGQVNVTVATDEDGECVIIAVTTTGTGVVLEKYTYNGTSFEGQTVYNSGVLNVWGATF